jgi:hypothetical protein
MSRSSWAKVKPGAFWAKSWQLLKGFLLLEDLLSHMLRQLLEGVLLLLDLLSHILGQVLAQLLRQLLEGFLLLLDLLSQLLHKSLRALFVALEDLQAVEKDALGIFHVALLSRKDTVRNGLIGLTESSDHIRHHFVDLVGWIVCHDGTFFFLAGICTLKLLL